MSHEILLKKLEYFGVRGTALNLFRSYLSNRRQTTLVGDSLSLLELLAWGVPQGSVLGPLLFLIFINDIPYASELLTWLFADDTALVASASSLPLLSAKINSEVKKVQVWLLANKLSVHYIKKSQYMLINKNLNNPINDDCDFELIMGNHLIERTKTYRYLGILLDEKLSWTAHITEICIKLSQVAGIFFKIRSLLSKYCLHIQ